MSMTDLENKVATLRELRRMADELAAEIAATEDELKAYMMAHNADTLHGPSFKIAWKEVESSRLDSKVCSVSRLAVPLPMAMCSTPCFLIIRERVTMALFSSADISAKVQS